MAGRLELATTGLIDQWLTGEPSHSLFLSRFRRHTPFSIASVETPFDGNPVDFGRTVSCRIPQNKGDLIRNMTVKITLTDPSPDNFGKNDNYYPPSVCSHMVEYADLVIGNQVIQRLTGEFIYIYNQLWHNSDDVEQSIYFLNGHGNFLTYSDRTYTYYMDLPFYFHRNSSLAIPSCALTKQLVEVRLTLRPFSEMLFMGGALVAPDSTVATGEIRNLSLDTEMVFLGEEERAYVMSRPMEYLITQLNVSQFDIKDGETERAVLLKFQGPVREMFFVSQSAYAEEKNLPNNYNTIKRVQLRFNNEVVFDRDTKYLTWGVPFRRHVNQPSDESYVTTEIDDEDPSNVYGAGLFSHRVKSDFGMYSFARNPQSPEPSGHVNFSRIAHKMLTVEIVPRFAGYDNKVRVYATTQNILVVAGGVAGLKF